MIELEGKYNKAKAFTNNLEDKAREQIIELLDQEFFKDSKIRFMPDLHYGAGCVIGTTATIKDKIVPNLVGVDIGCLDMETEFLSEQGWVKINKYKKGMKVLQYNKETDKSSFIEPINYIVKNCDNFYHFNNSKGLDQMLSEEHKMLIWKGFRGRGYKKENFSPVELSNKNLKNGFYGIKCSFNIFNEGIDYSNDEIRFLVALSADGYIRKEFNDKKFISFHLKKDRKIKRICQILNSLNISFKNYSGKDGTTYIEFYVDSKFNKSLSVLWKASLDQLKIVKEECLLWDGHSGYRSYFSSTNKESIDVIQFAFSATGTRAGIYEKTYDNNWKTVYNVIPTKNSIIGINAYPEIKKSVDGKKYCFTVPDGYFIIRRNNKISITGNCGMETIQISNKEIDFEKLDMVIRKNIPSGFAIRNSPHRYSEYIIVDEVIASIDKDRAMKSIGTLGGGNHFIEVNKDDEGNYYVVIHSGSRNMGKQIADYWQKVAIEKLNKKYKEETTNIITACISMGKLDLIEDLKNRIPNPPNDSLCYLVKEDFINYLQDMSVAQNFARINRKAMMHIIVEKMEFDVLDSFTTIHNYIDTETKMLRKGAVSANLGEKIIIPINMRDGSIIAFGKGNPDWNFSAPHGAGRLMGRNEAKRNLNIDEYKETMSGIYTTSVNMSTLDEAPMAYKSIDEIIENTKDTITIDRIIKPVYNFKDSKK